MWLITPFGFFSIVQKPADIPQGTLTLRARVKSDLETLKAQLLPTLGLISESNSNDYRFRAQAPQEDVAQAMDQMARQVRYSNFKNEVAKRQGQARAHLYHDVWDMLYRLQTKPQLYSEAVPTSAATPAVQPAAAPKPLAAAKLNLHPKPDNHGKPVTLKAPSQPSSLAAWANPAAIACTTPQGPKPDALHDIPLKAWAAPEADADWEAIAAAQASAQPFTEPEFKAPPGYKKAAGVVMQEPDGRVWLVCPSNQFAGYKATFPKGKLDGLSPRAAALKEAYEESGLQVLLLRHLIDATRSQSHTRYYLAERLGGDLAEMGWESQAVQLVPAGQLAEVAAHANDQPIVQALLAAQKGRHE